MLKQKFSFLIILSIILISMANLISGEPLNFSGKTKAEDIIQISGLMSKYQREKQIEDYTWRVITHLSSSFEGPEEIRKQGLVYAFLNLNYSLIELLTKQPLEIIGEKYEKLNEIRPNEPLQVTPSINKIAFLETTGIADRQNKANIATSFYTLGGTTLLAGFALPENTKPTAFIIGGLFIGLGLAIQTDFISNTFSFEKYAEEFQKERNKNMSNTELNQLADKKTNKIIDDERYWINGFAALNILNGLFTPYKIYGAISIAKGLYDICFSKGPVERMMIDYKASLDNTTKKGLQEPDLSFGPNDIEVSVSYLF